MQVAEKFGFKSELSSDFTTSILYALAAPSMPEEVRTEIIERVENGEKVDLKEIERLKKQAADLLAEKQAIQHDLEYTQKMLDLESTKYIESSRQRDHLRDNQQLIVEAKIAEERAKLILENQQAIAEIQRLKLDK